MQRDNHGRYESLSASSSDLRHSGLAYDAAEEPPRSPLQQAHPTTPLILPSQYHSSDLEGPRSPQSPPLQSYSTSSLGSSRVGTPNRPPRGVPPADFQSNYAPPPGAGPPRYLGSGYQHSDWGAPVPRDSLHQERAGTPSIRNVDGNNSVYALNPRMNMGRQGSFGNYHDDHTDSFYAGSETALPLGFGANASPLQRAATEKKKRLAYQAPAKKSRRTCIIWSCLLLVLVLAGAGVGIYFGLFNKKSASAGNNNSGSSGNSSSPNSPSQSPVTLITGGQGSTITMDDGSTMTYANSFGGTWYYDETDPFNNNAQAQSWSPPLNTTFKFGQDKIRGVNIGGWLVLEPFMQVTDQKKIVSAPALFEKYHGNQIVPKDEWVLSEAMNGDTRSGGGLSQLEDHYATFITEADFAAIASAGLNWVRIGLPWWAIETRGEEPFLEGVCWTYFLKAIKWARKYGIRINLDFHAVPGSQNGWNHSGRLGTINMLKGPMGYANAQRTLDYTRIIAEFISQPEYKDVVAMFGILNEPLGSPEIGKENMQRYYLQAYKKVRGASGYGEGKGPMISLHEAFIGLNNWVGVYPNADRLSLDFHPYLCFGGQQTNAPMSSYAKTPCNSWGAMMNDSMSNFGLTVAGEFSLAVTDCGKWLTGVDLGTRYEGTAPYDQYEAAGKCSDWTNYPSWSQSLKNDYKTFALASMDALQNWFFWTWKIGNSTVSGRVESPHWSYSLGLQNGWMPTDPRQSDGRCGNTHPWSGQLQAYQTGGGGAGPIPASATAGITWPPVNINAGGPVADLPAYTPTGAIPSLGPPNITFTGTVTPSTSINAGNGWAQPTDTQGLFVEKAGCTYLDPWVGNADPPSPLCAGGAKKRRAAPPLITPRPS